MNPYPENSKIYYLYEKIRQNDFLKKHIIEKIPFFEYRKGLRPSLKGLTFLLFKTICYPFFNDYLDEYLKLFPEKIDEKDSEGDTLFMKCVRYNKYISMETIQIILIHKPNMNLVDEYNKSDLYYAAKNIKLVKLLLKHGFDPNTLDHMGNTILFYASKRPEVVQILLDHGSNPNILDHMGNTILFYASKRPEVVQILLDHGSNPNILDNMGNTILFYAFENPKLVQILLDHGSNPNVINKNGNTVFLSFIQKLTCNRKIFVISQSVKLLLKYNVDLNHKNNNGQNALYLCCDMPNPNVGKYNVIKKLIKYGAKIDCYDYVDEKGISNSLVNMIIERKNYYIFNLILPNRKSFIQKIKNKYFDYPFIDFKIAPININSFHLIIQFL